jgi:hypothetical protein
MSDLLAVLSIIGISLVAITVVIHLLPLVMLAALLLLAVWSSFLQNRPRRSFVRLSTFFPFVVAFSVCSNNKLLFLQNALENSPKKGRSKGRRKRCVRQGIDNEVSAVLVLEHYDTRSSTSQCIRTSIEIAYSLYTDYF